MNEKPNTAVATTSVTDLKALLERGRESFAKVAPRHLKVDRVIKLLLAATSRNPKLLKCSQKSVLNFCMRCSETGLEPIGAGGAWPVPYENRKTGEVEMQFIPDYRGLIGCAKRAGCITDAYAEIVKANDEFEYELGTDPRLTHKPARADRGALQCAYCVFVLPDGTKRFVVMDADEIRGIRGRSRASESGPWVTDEAEMWKKTVVRRAMKPFAGASESLDKAIAADDEAHGLVTDAAAEIKEPREKVLPPATDKPADEPEPEPEKTPDPGPADDSINVQIKALYDVLPAKKVNSALRAAGIDIESGEEWEQAPDDKRKALLSLLKAAK